MISIIHVATAARDSLLALDGPSDLARGFPRWLALSTFAHIPSALPATPGLHTRPRIGLHIAHAPRRAMAARQFVAGHDGL